MEIFEIYSIDEETTQYFLPSSAPISVSAWAEIILVPDNPGKPAEWPSGIVIFRSNTAFKSKLKVFYSMNRTLK